MSRIYFHNEHAEVEVRGSERAYAASICTGLLTLSLGIDMFMTDHPILKLIPKDSYLHSTRSSLRDALSTWLAVSTDSLEIDGKNVSIFEVALQTAWIMGSAPIQFLARLHGQCEIHCYVEETNRAWLAGLIESGLDAGIMRKDMGWDSVIALLKSDSPGPVVTSYSVCQSFPDAYEVNEAGMWTPPVDESGEKNWDAWYALPESEQWRLGMDALRTHADSLELRPTDWAEFYFGWGLTGFDVLEKARLIE